MKNIIFYLAAFCILSQAMAAQTLFVTKKGLQVVDGSSPLIYKCKKYWSITFTNNGRTATLETINGKWTLTGLSSSIAVAAVNEATTLVSTLAIQGGVSNPAALTTQTIGLASALAKSIGLPTFDLVLNNAVNFANDVLNNAGVQIYSFSSQIVAATALLGRSGTVIDASNTSVADVRNNAHKVIGTILAALASHGVLRR